MDINNWAGYFTGADVKISKNLHVDDNIILKTRLPLDQIPLEILLHLS